MVFSLMSAFRYIGRCALVAAAVVASSVGAVVVRTDLHSHGEWSDIKCTLDDSVSWHKERGFDAMAITNHDHLTPPDRIRQLESIHDFTIIPGLEWSSREMHILAFFNPDTYDDLYMNITEDERRVFENSGICVPPDYRMYFMSIVHKYGGLVGVAHPTLRLLEKMSNGYIFEPCDTPGLVYMRDAGIDFVEVANTIPDHLADTFADKFSVVKTAGTDVHEVSAGIVVAKTLIDIGDQPVSARALFEGIKAGNVTIEYSSWWGALSDDVRKYLALIVMGIVVLALFNCFFFITGCYTWVMCGINKCVRHKQPVLPVSS